MHYAFTQSCIYNKIVVTRLRFILHDQLHCTSAVSILHDKQKTLLVNSEGFYNGHYYLIDIIIQCCNFCSTYSFCKYFYCIYLIMFSRNGLLNNQ